MAVQLTRRELLKIIGGLATTEAVYAALAAAGALNLVGCAPKPAAEPTKVPTKAEPTVAPTKAEPTVAPTKAEPTAAPTKAEATKAPEVAGKCQMDWNPTFPPAPKKYDPPVEVNVIWEQAGMEFPKEGNWSWDNNPMYNRCVEHTGLKPLKHWEAPGDLRRQKLAADLAAGTLPDYFHAGGLFLEQLIDAGAIEDIKEIWEATATPLTKEKKMYPDYKWWLPTLRGGKLYGIPFLWGPAYNVDHLCYIRQDWLDQLGIKAPETVAEWGEVAKKFKDAGLAKFGISACKNLVTWFHSLDPIFGAFGVMPTCWVKAADGTLQYDSISPAVKDALAVIRGWYKDGLMDPDFYTYGEGDANGGVGTAKVGIFCAPWWGSNRGLEKEISGLKISVFGYPKGPGGKQGRKASAAVQDCVVFRKGLDPIKIEAAINNLNWHMDLHVNWEKYQQYGEYWNSSAFSEGFTWVWDENCELKDGPVPNGMEYNYMQQVDFGFAFLTYPAYQSDTIKDLQKWAKMDKSQLNKAQRYLVNHPGIAGGMGDYAFVYDTRNVAIANEYFGIATEDMKKVLPDLRTLESQTFLSIVTGNADLNSFDQFVKDWRANGGDAVTRDVNAWWKGLGK